MNYLQTRIQQPTLVQTHRWVLVTCVALKDEVLSILIGQDDHMGEKRNVKFMCNVTNESQDGGNKTLEWERPTEGAQIAK